MSNSVVVASRELPGQASLRSCFVPPGQGFAYLVAARIVNTVWQESMGYPLTIANYFPRNPEQRDALRSLTEETFIPSNWSLRELLVTILTVNTFNRRAPALDSPDAGVYQEPPMFNPWVIPDPRTPPASDAGWDPSAHPDLYRNAMTDENYRYSAWSLLRSTQRALDWPGPTRFPSASYPNRELELSIGQYFSANNQGFRSTNFAALLAWEKEHGICANHRSDAGPDWVERPASQAGAFQPDGGSPLTMGDLLVVERDWLLGDGTLGSAPPPGLSQSELDALAGVAGSLDAGVSALPAADLRSKLRNVCGLMIETPQFFLAGVAPEGQSPVPRLRVCNDTTCSYQQMCQELSSQVTLPAGFMMSCGSDSVSVTPFGVVTVVPLQDQFFITFCPECPVVPFDPQGCFKEGPCPEPPACDPRCNRVDCCGGPGGSFDRLGTVLLWADGATVKEAEGVAIRRSGARSAVPLRSGEKLGYGDYLQLPPTARLTLDDGGKVRKYAPATKVPVEKLGE